MALDANDRNAFHNTGSVSKSEVVSEKKSMTWSIAKVFMFMFMFIAISGITAAGVILGLTLALRGGADPNVLASVYLGMLIASAVAMFIMMIVVNVVILRGKHSVLVPGIIYSVLVGILLSSLTMVLMVAFGETGALQLIGMAFGITCGAYLVMSLIAFLTKGSMNVYLIAILGLLIGSVVLVIINLFLRSSMISWIISFAIFALIIFTTIVDLHNMKKMAEHGMMTTNLELFCAFNLYVDFINIFIRILYYLAIIFLRRK